jgi:glycosyltransferase involved in cell wall biosynthesis
MGGGTSTMTIRVLSTCYNAKDYIDRAITSLKQQSITDWKCYITDDVSTDDTVETTKLLISGDDRFELIENKEKFWQTGNYWQVLQKEEIDDNDICITLDSDDWLPDVDVLKRIVGYYEDPNTWITCGQFIYSNGKRGFAKMPNPFVNLRKLPWTSTHMRTWKAWLFRKIKKESLLGPDGTFIPMAGDIAFMSPMLEMAGPDRVRYVDDVNYVYNVETNLNEHKVDMSGVLKWTQFNGNIPPCERLEEGFEI